MCDISLLRLVGVIHFIKEESLSLEYLVGIIKPIGFLVSHIQCQHASKSLAITRLSYLFWEKIVSQTLVLVLLGGGTHVLENQQFFIITLFSHVGRF